MPYYLRQFTAVMICAIITAVKEREVINLYEKIEQLLNENNMSAYKLSKETGIPQTCLADYKKGRANPKIDKLKIMANYFNVPIEYFLEE